MTSVAAASTARSLAAPRPALIWLPLLGLAAVPLISTNPYVLSVWTFILISLIVVVGLDLLLGYGGQLSLGHGVFVSIGAYTSALLTTRAGWSGWTAMPLGMVAAAVIALIVGVPTLRLRGYYLAMATLGFPVVLDAVLRNWSGVTGGSSGVTGVPRLAVGDFVLKDPVPYYFFVLAMLCLVYLIAERITRSRFGLALRAVHADEPAAAARGVDVARTKVIVFVCSAVFAALSGSLYVHYIQFVAPDTFGIPYSIMLVVMLVVGGAGRLWGGVLGTVALMWLPEALRATSTWEPIVFGTVLAVVMLRAPHGIAGLWRRRPALFRAIGAAASSAVLAPPAATRPSQRGRPLLEADMSRSFGGVHAVAGLRYAIEPGRIQAIIGPNGAGKSTALALIAGTLPLSSGSIRLGSHAIEELPAHQRARLGIGRTFQHLRLIPGLSVAENVLLGAHAAGDRASHQDTAGRVGQILQRLGLMAVADAYPSEINQYQCRLTEIGAALAGLPSVLLLDEPAAGLSTAEIDRLAAILREARDAGCAVILVDHVMQLVMATADDILVLEYGTAIAEGPPRQILDNPHVRAAYLGTRRPATTEAVHG
jgi:branched-chain amino acid transport system permease protein